MFNDQLRKSSLKLTYPKQPPYKNSVEYCVSKKTFDDISHFHSTEWDKPGQDSIYHLLTTERIFYKTSKELALRREFAKNERKKLEAQWEDLSQKEIKLRETFRNLNTFIQSNKEKRQRARVALKEDYAVRIKRTEEIKNLQQMVDLLITYKKEVDANLAQLKMYEKYLNQVVSAGEDFKNADDLISRYEALVSTKNVLGKRQDENLRELETARAKIAKIVEENSFKILGYNTVLASLNSRYNSAFREALHWENIVLAIKDNSFKRYQEITQVRQSCWNMYLLMCKRKSEAPKISEDDFEKQLIYIKKTLQELGTVKLLTGRDSKEIGEFFSARRNHRTNKS